MRYRIEFLLESTDENSVCHVKAGASDRLENVGKEAFDYATTARRLFGATGFQIREQTNAGRIVALETF